MVKYYARNVDFAVKKASNDLGSNIGLYLFAKLEGRSVMHLEPGPFPSEHSIAIVRMPVVYVFENEKCKHILFTFYEKISRSQDILLRDLKNIIEILSIIKKVKNRKLKILIIETFGYYYDALKSTKYSLAFMNFWNIIERLYLKTNEITLKEVVTRLKSTFSEDITNRNDIVRLIDVLFRKRNLYVHESKDTITSEDRDYLKSIIEHVIFTLLNLCIEFDDIGMLEFFYQNLGKPLRIIKKEFKILKLLERLKSQ